MTSFLKIAIDNGYKLYDERQKNTDLIYLSYTIEHWVELHNTLSKLFDANLSNSGRVIIEVPLIDRLILGYRQGEFHEIIFVHNWYFSSVSLGKLGKLLGFKCVLDRVTTMAVFERETQINQSIQRTNYDQRWRIDYHDLGYSPRRCTV